MFLYSSDERHSVGDKPGHYRQRTVKLRGTKGTKTESYWKGSKLVVKHKLNLTPKEVNCIRTRKFMPGLWDACTQGCANKTLKRSRRSQ